jgi:hypothetical protein
MINVNITDNTFTHCPSISANGKPKYFQWDTTSKSNSKYNFYTDNFLQVKDTKSVALLIEPPQINCWTYDYVKNNYFYFNYVLTWNRQLDIPNALFYPFGCCWIDDSDCLIHKKTKNISMIASEKDSASGHRLRHEVVKNLTGFDLYGRVYNPIEKKITGLKDYRFQIVIENEKINDWFTEKIIDCFQTGTIPIYWGCDSIGEYFDINGIITFNSIEHLKEIIRGLDDVLYKKKINSVINNFNLSRKYKIPEDWIYEKYPNLFLWNM